MPQKRVKFTLKGAHEGKDFTPKFAPRYAFKGGVFETVIDESEFASVSHMLSAYGAVGEIVEDEALAQKQANEKAAIEANDAAIAKAQAFEQDKAAEEAEMQAELKTAKTKGPRRGGKTTAKTPAKSETKSDGAGDAAPEAGKTEVQSSEQENELI